jgi:hypothetical protein
MGHDEFDAAEAVPPGVRMRGVTSFLNRGAASLSIGLTSLFSHVNPIMWMADCPGWVLWSCRIAWNDPQ